ncbi:Riboflavin synthase [Bienertia sinuspersici]
MASSTSLSLFSPKLSQQKQTFCTLKNNIIINNNHLPSNGHIKFTQISKPQWWIQLKVEGKIVLQDVNLGDSIAVNGTCLTVTEFDAKASEFTLGLAPETLRKTTLMSLEPGSLVNLERALQPSTRMGGHFVQVSYFSKK